MSRVDRRKEKEKANDASARVPSSHLKKLSTQLHYHSDRKSAMRSGIYTFTNASSGAAMDLSGDDGKSLIGFPVHGGENQRWELAPLGLGFSIRSISSGQYMTIEAGIYNGVPIVASGFPASWVVEVDVKDDDTVQISWPGSHYSIGLVDDSVPGTKIQLWQKYPWNACRAWKFARCSDVHIPIESRGSQPRDVVITTTTTVVTKVYEVASV